MNAQRIMELSRAGTLGLVKVEVIAETGSTNADLLARAPALEAPVLLLARHQTAGRGRAGRSWLSAPGHSLTFSLAWKFDGGLHRCWHGSEMHRDMSGLRNQAPLSIKAGAGVVLALLDIGRERGSHQACRDLVRRRFKRACDDFEFGVRHLRASCRG